MEIVKRFIYVLIFACLYAAADENQQLTADGFTFETRDEGIVITGYTGELKDIIIPKLIDGKQVIGIGEFAFCDDEEVFGLTSVVLPEGIQFIECGAFDFCTSLKSINFPQTLQRIEGYSFECTALTEVVLSSEFTEIGEFAFQCCKKLNSLTLPKSVIVNADAFEGCSSLQSISFSDSNNEENIITIGDEAFANCSNLSSISWPKGEISLAWGSFGGCTKLNNLEFPKNLKRVGTNSFYACAGLKKVCFSNETSLTVLESSSFADCTSLIEVELPDSLLRIGSRVFSNCSSLTTIKLPNNLTTIDDYAFSGCSNLENIDFPKTLTYLGNSVFSGCSSLTKVNLFDSLTYLGNSVFSGCSSLTTVHLPDNLTQIRSSTFSGCSKLTTINLPNDLLVIDSSAFLDCASLKNIDFPDNLTTIRNSAFSGCSGLTAVSLPERLSYLGSSAFSGCSSLETIHFPESLTSISSSTFSGCSSLECLVFPWRMRYIGNEAFKDCVKLSDLRFRSSIYSIGQNCFVNTELKLLFFEGNIPDGLSDSGANWSDVTIIAYKDTNWADTSLFNYGATIELHERYAEAISAELQLDTLPNAIRIIHGVERISSIAEKRDEDTELFVENEKVNNWNYENEYIDSTRITDGYHLFVLNEGSSQANAHLFVLNSQDVQIHDGCLSNNENWQADKLHIVRNWVRIPEGMTLTIEEGAIVKFCKATGIQNDGVLVATEATLTSIEDDSVGGDTDMNGENGTLAYGVYSFTGKGTFTIRNCNIYYPATLPVNTTWVAGSINHINGMLTVGNGVTLTIEPGAIVKLATGSELKAENGGNIIASGVLFTHMSDDSEEAGGATNGDASSTKPVLDAYKLTGFTPATDCKLRFLTLSFAGGTISDVITLSGYSVHKVTGNITIASGGKLVVEPGAVVKMNANAGLSITVDNGGTLEAIGNQVHPIVFTSIRDDAHGGDSNGDDGKREPKGGDWRCIIVCGNAQFRFCELLYGGSTGNRTISMIMTGAPGVLVMDNCIVAHSMSNGIENWGGRITVRNSIITDVDSGARPYQGDEYTNCIFFGNNYIARGAVDWTSNVVFNNCVFKNMGNGWLDGDENMNTCNNSHFNHCVFHNDSQYRVQSCVKAGVNGNLYADPLFTDPEKGDFTLKAGSPCIDAGDGSIAPEKDYWGKARMNVVKVTDRGKPNENGVCPDIGIFEMPGSYTGSACANLSVGAVAGPEEASSGDMVAISWTVTNDGNADAVGPWRDVVFLQGVDEALGGQRVELGEYTVTGALTPLASRTESAQFMLPPLKPGNWRIGVVTNSYRDVYEVKQADNQSLAEGTTVITLPAWSSGNSKFTVAGYGETGFMLPPSNTARIVMVTLPSGSKMSVFGASGYLPSSDNSDTKGVKLANGAILLYVPANMEKAYVTLANEGRVSAEATVSVSNATLTLLEASPSTVLNKGYSTIRVIGTGLSANSVFKLTLGSTIVTGTVVSLENGLVATAQFNVNNIAPGNYTLSVTENGQTASLPGRITVKANGIGPKLEAWLEPPANVRDGRIYTAWLCYKNSGDADMTMPLFEVSCNATTKLSYTVDGEYESRPLRYAGISPTAPAGVLKAGEEHRVPIFFTLLGSYQLSFETINCNEKPHKSFATWREYGEAMAQAATRLNARGKEEYRGSVIYGQVLKERNGQPCSAISGYLRNSYTGEGVDGVTIVAYRNGKEALTVTSAEGYYQLADLNGAGEYAIEVRPSCHEEALMVTLSSSKDLNNYIIDFMPLPCIKGWISAGDTGQMLADMRVVLRGKGSDTQEVMTDEEGYYEIKGILPGDYTLEVLTGNGYSGKTLNSLSLSYSDGIKEYDFQLNKGVVVAGNVLKADTQEKLSGIEVVLTSSSSCYNYFATSNENGAFSISGLPTGRYVVGIIASDYRARETADIEVSNDGLSGLDIYVVDKELFHAFPNEFALAYQGDNIATEFIIDNKEILEKVKACWWDFDGDGICDSTDLSPIYTYTAPGSYTVTLRVTTDDGIQESVYADCVKVREAVMPVLKSGVYLLNDLNGLALLNYDDDMVTLQINNEDDLGKIAKGAILIWCASDESDGWGRKIERFERNGSVLKLWTSIPALNEIYTTCDFSVQGVFESADENATRSEEDEWHETTIPIGQGSIRNRVRITPTFVCNLRCEGGYAFFGFTSHEVYEHRLNIGIASMNTGLKAKREKPIFSKKTLKMLGWVPVLIDGGVYFGTSASVAGQFGCTFYFLQDTIVESGFQIVLGGSNRTFDFTPTFRVTRGSEQFNLNGFAETDVALKVYLRAEFNCRPFLATRIGAYADLYAKLDYSLSDSEVSLKGGLEAGIDLMFFDLGSLINDNLGETVKDWLETDLEAGINLNRTSEGVLWRTGVPRAEFDIKSINHNTRSVVFDDLSTHTDNIAEYNWDYGDGTLEHTFGDSVHNYKTDGIFDVTLGVQGKFWSDARTYVLKIAVGGMEDDDLDDARPQTKTPSDRRGNIPQRSCDPNEISGMVGLGDAGTQRFVKPGEWLDYTVYFENKSTAAAPAQEVLVTHNLSRWLDWSTLELGEIVFNNQIQLELKGKSRGKATVPQDGANYHVQMNAAMDETTGEFTLYLRSYDKTRQAYGYWPESVYAGFLPPNDDTHRGEGHFTFRVKVKDDAPDGAFINAEATIVFDANAPITTSPAWFNWVTTAENPEADATTLLWDTADDANGTTYVVNYWSGDPDPMAEAATETSTSDALTDGSWSLPDDLDTGTYYWNVTKTNGEDSSQTSTWSFEIVASHVLTVNGGTGGGTYKANSAVTIAANEVAGKSFTNWTVDGMELLEAQLTENPLLIAMPDNDVTLTANFQDEAVEDPQADGFLYTIADGKVTIAKYIGDKSEVVIPQTIEDKPVTAIGAEAFKNCKGVSSVSIPDGVTTVGNDAFSGCTGLTVFVMPGNITFGDNAFGGCTSLAEIDIPANVTFGDGAFGGCAVERDVIIGENAVFGNDAFSGCVVEGDVIVGENAAFGDDAFSLLTVGNDFTIAQGCTFNDNAFNTLTVGNNLTIAQGCTFHDNAFNQLTVGNNLTIAEGCTFGNSAFTNCTVSEGNFTLLEVSFGDDAFNTLTVGNDFTIAQGCTFNDGAFTDCTVGLDFTIGNEASFGDDAFSGCVVEGAAILGHDVSFNDRAFCGSSIWENLVLSESVSFGDGAFCECTSLMSIDILDGVGLINNGAFSGCTSLTSVNLAGSVTSIGDNAFSGCTALKNITFNGAPPEFGENSYPTPVTFHVPAEKGWEEWEVPDGVTLVIIREYTPADSFEYSIENGEVTIIRFIGEETEVLIPPTIEDAPVSIIGSEAFLDCTDITSIIIPDGVVSIEQEAFRGCSNLTTASIPDSVTTIGEYAFRGCTSLESIIIPDSVTSIYSGAFYCCENLTSITIGANVTSIYPLVFGYCSKLNSIAIRGNVTSITWQSFYGCNGVASLEFADDVTSIDVWQSFLTSKTLTSITVSASNTQFASQDGVLFNKEMTKLICYPRGKGQQEYATPIGVISIEANAFSYCDNLTTVTLPEGLECIYRSAFFDCSNLESINIPRSVTFIDDEAFSYCQSIASITLPDGLKTIGPYAFSNCSTLESIAIPDSVTDIGNGVLSGCTSLASITLPDGLEDIVPSAFSYCSHLESITIPDSVLTIGNDAFSGCSSLTSMVIPDGVAHIGDSAFLGCSGLTSIEIPEGVEYIGYSAFEGCSSLESFTIPDSVTEIGGAAFYGCSSLTSIAIPDGVEYIVYSTFGGCSSLESITIPDSVTVIESAAFEGCSGLESITIPESVTEIGDCAFSGCSSLTSIVIPEGVEYINERTFSDCSSLTSIVIPEGVEGIGFEAFSGCSSLSSIVIREGVEYIAEFAFSGCSSLKSITIPGSVTNIDEGGFEDCTSLATITFRGAPPAFGENSYPVPIDFKVPGGMGWEEWEVPEGVTLTIDFDFEYEISEYNNEVTITRYLGDEPVVVVPASIGGKPVTSVCHRKEYMGSIVPDFVMRVVLPDSIKVIDCSAFMGAKGLESIKIPDSVVVIGPGAFRECESLTSIVIPDSVSIIASNAFRDCSSLKTISFGSDVEELGGEFKGHYSQFSSLQDFEEWYHMDYYNLDASRVFQGCTSLEAITVDEGNEVYASQDGVLFDKEMSVLKWYPAAKKEAEYAIPEGVVEISTGAFAANPFLTSVTLPASIRWIRTTFGSCVALAAIEVDEDSEHYLSDDGILFSNDRTELICYPPAKDGTHYAVPDSVTEIGDGAFEGCSGLVTIDIPDSVTEIGDGAFEGCSGLVTIDIPNSVTEIGVGAFEGCSGLTAIVIPEGVTCLRGTFKDCASLTTVSIPASVEEIGEESFEGCANLVSIDVSEESENYASIDGVLFNKSLTSLIQYPAGNPAASYSIPVGVECISEKEFFGCANLVSVSIPASVEEIGDEAFAGCVNLTSLVFKGAPPEFWDENEVADTYPTPITFYVPEGKGWEEWEGPDGVELVFGEPYSLELNAGWNWVGFRVLPQGSHRVNDILGTEGFSVNDVIQTSGGSARFNGTSWIPSEFTIEHGKLYQIYTEENTAVGIVGTSSQTTEIPVSTGWNWLANTTEKAVMPEQLVHSGGWSVGDRIQTGTGSFVTFNGTKWIPSTGFILEPGTGFQVFSKKEGSIEIQ